jgi:FKBP-type peptidyl-prolyl cis-trans isomerase (trigger factor)
MPRRELILESDSLGRRTLEIAEVMHNELVASIRKEVEQRIHSELLAEIAAAEEELQKKEDEITSTMTGEAFNYGAVMRLRTESLELSAYLKGLLYRATKTSIRG